MSNTEKQDVYTRITSKIIASLEPGVRPWIQRWNAEHAAGKITRRLRHNGQAYSGSNILMLRASALEQGFAARIWHTRLAIASKDSVGCNSCPGGVGPPASLRFRRAQ